MTQMHYLNVNSVDLVILGKLEIDFQVSIEYARGVNSRQKHKSGAPRCAINSNFIDCVALSKTLASSRIAKPKRFVHRFHYAFEASSSRLVESLIYR